MNSNINYEFRYERNAYYFYYDSPAFISSIHVIADLIIIPKTHCSASLQVAIPATILGTRSTDKANPSMSLPVIIFSLRARRSPASIKIDLSNVGVSIVGCCIGPLWAITK